MQLPLPPKTCALLELFEDEEDENGEIGAEYRVTGLSGCREIVAYRLILLAGWQVIKLFEQRRGELLRIRAKRHPLPGARLLAHMQTLIECFGGDVIPKTGDRIIEIDEDLERRFRLFFDEVTKPVLKLGWQSTNEADANDGFEATPEMVAQETLKLLTNRAPSESNRPRNQFSEGFAS